MTHVVGSLSQVGYRGRNDNGSQTSATWKSAENVGWTQNVDENFRVRFVVDETAGGSENNVNLRLQYNLAGAGWNNVTATSNVVRAQASPNITEEGATTRQLTSGTGTFVAGALDESDGLAGSNNQIDYAGGELTEVEYCCSVRSVDVAEAQTLQLRVVRDGGTLDAWTQTPTVTVSEGAAAGAASQERFRVRSDDSQTVNADAGWAAATNTNVSLPPEQTFRIRFGVESVGGVTQAYKIQSRYQPVGGSFGSWSDMIVENGPLAASAEFAPTCMHPSDGFTDGAATTDLLGGTGAFVAGTAEEGGPALTNTTAAIALASVQRTEVEFAVRIHKWSDNRVFVATNDLFEYRLVEASSGTVLTYTNTPQITVAQGQGVIGGTWIEGPARIGPIRDGNGNLYACIEYTEVTPRLNLIKSTDGGDYWVDATLVGRSDLADMEAVDVRPDAAGDILHILLQGVSSDNVYYFRYHTSSHATTPDTWAIIDEPVILGPDPLEQSVSLEPRADGTIVAFYTVDEGLADHVAYKIRSAGGAWGTATVIDTGDSVAYAQCTTVTDSVGVIWLFYTSTAAIFYRTLGNTSTNPTGPGDVLSARTQIVTDTFSSPVDRQPLRPAVHYLSGADEVVTLAWATNNNTPADQLRTVQIINGTVQSSQQASDRTVTKDQGQSRQPAAHLSVDGTTLHIVYSDAATQDMWHTSRVHGGSWDASTEIGDGLSCHWINTDVFTHSAGNGGGKVVGVVYDNGSAGFTGFGRYTEFALAGGTGHTATVTDAVGIDDTDPSQTAVYAGVGTDPVGLVDTVVATPGTGPLTAAAVDPVAVADTVVHASVHARTVTDPVGAVDTATTSASTARVVTDAVDIDESAPAQTVAWQATGGDPVDITDTVTVDTGVGAPTATVTDPVAVTDTTVHTATHAVTVADTVAVTDTADVAASYTRTVTDTVGAVDAAATVAPINLTVTDPVGITEAAQTQTVASTETIPDPVAVADTATHTATHTRTVTNGVGLADTAVASSSGADVRAPTDPVAVADTVVATGTTVRTVTDPAGIVDTAARAATAAVTVTDAVAAADTVAVAVLATRTVADLVGVTDAADQAATHPRTTTDAVAVVDTTTVAAAPTRTPVDPAGVTDAVTWTATHTRTVTDPVGVTDTVTASTSSAAVRTVTDPVAAADTLTVTTATVRDVVDPAAVADTADQATDHTRTVTDLVAAADTASASVGLPSTVTDPVDIADATTQAAAHARTVTDPVALTDAQAVIKAAERIVTDALGLLDTSTQADDPQKYIATFLETTRRFDRFTGTPRNNRHTTTARPRRHTTTTRDTDRFHATTRYDHVTGTIRYDHVTGTIRYQRFHTTRIYREDADVALNIVALGDLTQGEIPEGLLIQWVRTHNDETTSGLPLFNQTPTYTVTGKLEQPDLTIVSRACTILDPTQLSVLYPDEPQIAPFVDGTEGWVLFEFDEGDLDQIPGVGELTRIQLVAARATTPPTRLKTADVWNLTVNTGPAAAVGA